jgi:Protein of unknown function (DUF982)
MSQEKGNTQLCIWDVPVHVRIGSGMTETIDGPEEALNYLMTRWPAERGPHYERANVSCDAAVHRYGSLGEAREAFIAAAIEARVLA